VTTPSQTAPSIVLAVPLEHREHFFPSDLRDRLDALGRVAVLDDFATYADALMPATVVITGWGAPPLDEQILANAPHLRLLAHTGASVKPFVTAESWRRGIKVTQAGAAMAQSVAERALAMTLGLLQRVPYADRVLHDSGSWDDARAGRRHEISGARVGVIGASRTGRAYAKMVLALNASVQMYDPYLSDAVARELGVRRVDLRTLLSTSLVVAMHAPVTDETKGMLGVKELACMPDGSVLINTARADLIDTGPLIAELATGRIAAGFDVYDVEPLSDQHPLRRLSNVVLTPHTAGNTVESRRRAGEIVVDEIRRFLDGQPLQHEITEKLLLTIG
jgi:phosphoglycerate dehydrogenase-like enzyme